jgi:hypothetical protein
MNNKIKLIMALLLISIFNFQFSILCHAAFNDPGYGARPVAMGGAFTAVGDDTNCILYNPAGLAGLEGPEMNYMYSQLYTGLDTVNLGLGYGAFAYPMGEKYGTVGIGWAELASQNQYSEDTFALSYGRSAIAGKLDVGANVKYLTHKYTLDERTVNDPVFAGGNARGALSIDLGAQSTVPFLWNHELALGIALSDVNTPDVGLASTDKVPMQARVGAACNITENILTALDVSYRFQEWGDSSDMLNVHVGGEAWFLNRVLAARAGANLNELAVGFGFAPLLLKNFDVQLDYSFVLPLAVQETSGSHRISLIVRFLGNTPKPGKTQTVQEEKPTSQVTKPIKSGKVHATIPEN